MDSCDQHPTQLRVDARVESHAMPRRLIAVIPARAGSKRVPHKNVRELCGRPILAYTIEAAIEARVFDRVIVTTDSDEVAKLAEAFGAEVPFYRDPALADDHTPVSAATLDALNQVDPNGTMYSCVAQLMVNCPLRTAADIRASLAQFVTTRAQSQISITSFGWFNPWWAVTQDESRHINPLFPPQTNERSQDLPRLYCPTGAIWWITAATLREAGTFHISNRTGWEIDWHRAVDIDTEDDWCMAELLMRDRLGQGSTQA